MRNLRRWIPAVLGLAIVAPAAHGEDSGLFQYALPRRSRPILGATLGIGALMLATDARTVRWFDIDREEAQPDAFYRYGNWLGDGRTLVVGLAGVYALGRDHERRTATLAGAALVNATVATVLLKGLSGRERPNEGNERGGWKGLRSGDTSFPSGHTAATTAVAHVLAREYPKSRWLWYGLAAGVGVSRITSRRHWPSDVFFGAGIGLLAGEGALRQRDSILSWRF